MANKRGAKRAAYQKEYNARPEEKSRRAALGRARNAYEAKNGDLPTNVELDHKKPKRHGGSDKLSNLKPVPKAKNAGWRRGKKDYD